MLCCDCSRIEFACREWLYVLCVGGCPSGAATPEECVNVSVGDES